MTREKFWLTQLSSDERSTLIGCGSGYAVDGMDFMVYSFVLPSLILYWHIGKGPAGLLGTSALMLSSFGGWLARSLLRTALAGFACCNLRSSGLRCLRFSVVSLQNFSAVVCVSRVAGAGSGRRVGRWVSTYRKPFARSIAAGRLERCRAAGQSAGPSLLSSMPSSSKYSRQRSHGARCSGLDWLRRRWPFLCAGMFPNRRSTRRARPSRALRGGASCKSSRLPSCELRCWPRCRRLEHKAATTQSTPGCRCTSTPAVFRLPTRRVISS